MRRFVILWMLCGGCGGGSGGIDDDTPVPELSSSSQEALCERFLDEICTHPEAASFCEDPCIATGCAAAVADGHVTSECMTAPNGGPITAGMVDECAAAVTIEVCGQGGGCMFDALEAACP